MFTLLSTATAWPQGNELVLGPPIRTKHARACHHRIFFDAGGISGQAVHVGQVGVGGEARESAGADVEVTEAASGAREKTSSPDTPLHVVSSGWSHRREANEAWMTRGEALVNLNWPISQSVGSCNWWSGT